MIHDLAVIFRNNSQEIIDTQVTEKTAIAGRVSVVVCVYNGEFVIPACIYALKAQTCRPQIIVIDDGSTDASSEVVLSLLDKDIDIHIRLEKNQGLSFARNEGVKHAHNEIVAFVDADGRPQPTWVEEIEFFFKHHHQSIGVMASRVIFESDPSVLNGLGGVCAMNGIAIDDWFSYPNNIETALPPRFQKGFPLTSLEVSYAMGNGLVARKSVLKRAGGFPVSAGNFYDDVHFCMKARRLGYRTLANPKAVVEHVFSHSSNDNHIAKLWGLEFSRVRALLEVWPRSKLMMAFR